MAQNETEKDNTPGMRRRPVQSRSRERVDRILSAALQLLEEGQALSTTGVAQRAGSPVGSLYQYFPNLDALLLALAERFVEELKEESDAVFSAAVLNEDTVDWETAIDEVVDTAVSRFSANTGYRRLLQALRFSDELHGLIGGVRRSSGWTVNPWLQRNGLSDEEAELISHLLFELIATLVLCHAQTAEETGKRLMVSEFKKLLILYLRDIFARRTAGAP